ncbi:endonuclease/exonuclease/phosphatase family protein [Aureibaculum luteum]|uniref:endonuclease/exonuclease/phosphatase family protein n=1 Tax=Aureibaculum luteum TaxID=1548456 RepID=UPI001E4F64A3|nr:endonuclease/exonuclease/phosphatase family protein [Aureibaculum luteum]
MKLSITIPMLFITLLTTNLFWSQHNVDSTKIVRVLSFNILHGATTKGDFNLDLIAKVIKDANPDFVAMQEVDDRTNRAKKYDLVTELGWRTKLSPLFGKAMDYDNGEYGEGILSKTSFLSTRNIALPYYDDHEPRAALEITTTLSTKDTISFIGTHLDHLNDERDRVLQVEKLNEIFSKNKYPTILAGDLNAEPNSTPINILEKVWTAAYDKNNIEYTYPSDNPVIKIDYVLFYPKNRWRVLETKVIQDTIASDHCAYLVTLELLDE